MKLKHSLRTAENKNDDLEAEIERLKSIIDHQEKEKGLSTSQNDSPLLASENERLSLELKEAQRTIKVFFTLKGTSLFIVL